MYVRAMHQSVLLQAAIDMLAIKPNGIYIDATFGRGGHARAILSQLNPTGQLIVIDQDLEAIDNAKSQFADDHRVIICHDSFANLAQLVEKHNLSGQIDGILADLGVSSPQLDQAARGFSFMKAGPLDMRMNQTTGQSVANWLETVDEVTLARIIWQYGEEKFSKRIARAIINARDLKPLETTTELSEVVQHCVPKSKKEKKHPATRTFQALRIFINQELTALEQLLADAPPELTPGGRFVVMSFHSLEDRLVKKAFHRLTTLPDLPRGLPIPDSQIQRDIHFTEVVKKLKATPEEISLNPRARSVILRTIEKR